MNPPPGPDEITEPGGEGEEPTRPGLRRVAGSPPPAPPRAPSAEAAREARERRERHISTLVGHPTGTSGPPPPPNSAPMLAPPKWTGASAYVEGQEPQPRVSALPAPQHVPLPPVADAEPSRSRVTTKVGHVQVQPQPVPPPVETSRAPAIGDAIQEMLDSQTAVSQQLDEPRVDVDADEEQPIDELQIEEILDGLSEGGLSEGGLSESRAPSHPVEPRGRERGDEPTLQHAAPPPPDAPPAAPVAAVNPNAFASERAAAPEPPRPPQAPPPPPAPPVAPAAAAPQPAMKEPVKEPARPRRPAIELGMHADAVSSLAPAEVRNRPRYRDDSQTGVGVLLLAAMAVIGVGGWYLTKGSYPGARPHPAQASAAVESTPATNTGTDGAKTPAGTATPNTTTTPSTNTSTSANPGAVEPAKTESAAPSASAAERKAKQRPVAAKSAETRDDAVVKVTPHQDSAELPDIPSRDNVVAALTPLRAAVTECAHGQRGVAQLDITVASTGAVTHAVVGGDFAGTSEGSCIARVARSATFVPFKKPRFRVIYPFSL